MCSKISAFPVLNNGDNINCSKKCIAKDKKKKTNNIIELTGYNALSDIKTVIITENPIL